MALTIFSEATPELRAALEFDGDRKEAKRAAAKAEARAAGTPASTEACLSCAAPTRLRYYVLAEREGLYILKLECGARHQFTISVPPRLVVEIVPALQIAQ